MAYDSMSGPSVDQMESMESDARSIYQASLDAVAPNRLIDGAIRNDRLVDSLRAASRTVLLACGKAACGMARRFVEHVPVGSGLITIPHGSVCLVAGRIEVKTSAHPVPDAASAAAAEAAMAIGASLDSGDLAIVLISGGGSSLWAGVPADITLEQKQATVRQLLLSGASIAELNTVRKHLSTIKGGGLARAIYPARSVSLIVSDVVGDDLSVIASGPTVADNSSFEEALAVLEQRGGLGAYPDSVVARLRAGERGRMDETPANSDPIFENQESILIGSNKDALDAAEAEATNRGYAVIRSGASVTGPAGAAGSRLARLLLDANVEVPTCYLWGGETTVVVQGAGKGGRNQELALSAAIEMSGAETAALLLSAGTDGIDGPTDAAGAMATPLTVHRGQNTGVGAEEYLSENDSYSFFSAAGGHLKTGPSGTNVMDVQVGLVLPGGQ
ncbi:MAG: DUF4147 domain-containing protein [Rhodothermia bacterium]|nr:DUF4147 domain-containing protein [Rhodothermia bacterium]